MGLTSGYQMEFTWEICNGPQLGGLEGLWVKYVMVRLSVDYMEFWSGVHKNYVAWSNGQVRGQKICGSGTWWAWWTGGFSEMSEPRLMTRAQQDAHTKGCDLLLNVYHNYFQAPPANGHESEIRYPIDVHCHRYARA